MRAALFAALVAGLVMLTSCGAGGGEATQRGASAPTPTGYTLSIPELGIVATPLAPVGLNPDHTMQTPPVEHPEQAAVYTGGPMPGQLGGGNKVGPAVILGHINGGGHAGVFARLGELKEGDTVQTSGPDGASTFQVYRTVVVDKDSFPTAQTYSATPTPELRLVSCGGKLDRSAHSYIGQVLVFARKV